jgi:hypothetical protein
MLILRRAGAPDRELFHIPVSRTYEHAIPSQRRFQVSPDARVLAYTRPDTGALHVLRRDGAELVLAGVGEDDRRFSADGRTLAVVRAFAGQARVDRVHLDGMEAHLWALLPRVRWTQLCADGLVASHPTSIALDLDGPSSLTLVPWEGPPRTLVKTDTMLLEFCAAAAGSRIVYTIGPYPWSLARPGAAPRRLSGEWRRSDNMEMSPDGSRIAFVTNEGLALVEGDAQARRFGAEPWIHSVWFSPDGAEVAWASPEVAVWRRGSEEHRLAPVPAGTRITAMRFLHGCPGLLVSRGRQVVRWRPDRNEVEELATVDDGRELLGADAFAGGLVLWLGTAWEKPAP